MAAYRPRLTPWSCSNPQVALADVLLAGMVLAAFALLAFRQAGGAD